MNLGNPEQFGFSSQRLTRITKVMQRYIDDGKSAGIITLVARQGTVVHLQKCGYQNLAEQIPIAMDTLFRIYSMTKPITSVALMMLYEQGLVRLEDPVHKFIPQFKSLKVLQAGGKLVAPTTDLTIWHLLTHTAGLSYGSEADSLIDKLYLDADLGNPAHTNEEMIGLLTELPLRYHPGDNWHYSCATDVVGYIIELISGLSLFEFFKKHIFLPLGMHETFFKVPGELSHRFSEVYGMTKEKFLDVIDTTVAGDFMKDSRESGGAGLVSTVADYYRFAHCMLNMGELDGVRLLGPRTVELMRCNHLPVSLLPLTFDGKPWPGNGFGLGFSMVLDITQSDMRGCVGSHGWGGWASTYFWLDPIEQILGILMLQYVPSGTYPIRNIFRSTVYQALTKT